MDAASVDARPYDEVQRRMEGVTLAVTSALDVAALVLARMGPLDTWKLQKLVYYSQAWHLAVFDRPLFDDPVQAWADGPVTPDLYRAHKGRRVVSTVDGGDPRALEMKQTLLVDLVCSHYGSLSGADLSDMTHQEQPWLDAREGLKPREATRRPIKHPAMAEFYRSRELNGRTAADLIAGGLWPPADNGDVTTDAELAQVRADFAMPAEAPAQDGLVSAQFATAPAHRGVARTRGMARPSRSARRA